MISQEELRKCQETIGYTFDDVRRLEKALTHSSRKTAELESNERLEFLGDAILGMVMADHLYEMFPDSTEGDLTKIKSVVVSRRTLAAVGKDLDLARFIDVGKGVGEGKSLPTSILGNVFEAIIASIYIDGGLTNAAEFIQRNLTPHIELVTQNQHSRNYKSILQQYVQKELITTPCYEVISEEGPDHVKSFHVAAIIKGKRYGTGWGTTKKDAEQRAAEETLEMLDVEES